MGSKELHIRNLSARWSALRHIRELCVILGAYFIYMLIRKFMIPDIETVAFGNAIKLISSESAAGFLWEPGWQAWAMEKSKALVMFLNWAYIITFVPIIGVTAVAVYIKDRPKYFYYRNVVLLSFVFALIIFATFPLAPPRFFPEYGFVDTIRSLGPSWWLGPSWYGNRDTIVYFNAFAAMPSLHFGWTILFCVTFLSTKSTVLRVVGPIYPILTFFAITVTGNHYILDAVGGVAIAVASLLTHEGFLRLKPQASPSLAAAKSYLGSTAAHLYHALLLVRRKAHALLSPASTKSRLRLGRLLGSAQDRPSSGE